MEKLDCDFSALEIKKHNVGFRFGYLEVAARYTDLGIEVRNYCKEHPACAVVNLGCGLDCTAENVTNIGADLNDTAWFDAIDDSRSVVFLLPVFSIIFFLPIFRSCSLPWRNGLRAADSVLMQPIKKAVKLMLKTWVKAVGITDIDRYFYINNLDTDLKAWLPGTEISAKGYMQMRIVQINF